MVTCDGCGARINNQWYRSLESNENCDLCDTCFNGEVSLVVLIFILIDWLQRIVVVVQMTIPVSICLFGLVGLSVMDVGC